MGYRRIRDELDGHKGIHVNDKRVLRICRKYDIKSNIKWKPKSCTRGDRNPDHIAKNYLHRDFHADKPNEKWLDHITAEEAKQYMSEGHFAPGSMLPKVQAAVEFAESAPGRQALITLLEKAKDGIKGTTGTRISQA